MENLKEDCKISEKSLKCVLHSLEKSFKDHNALLQASLDFQKVVIDSLWVISQRFLILTRGAICVRPYPRELSDRIERETRAEFQIKKDQLCNSNFKLAISLDALKQKCRVFDRAMGTIDGLCLPSQIIEGNSQRQPIYYYIELYADYLKHFQEIQNQLSLLGKSLMVDDIAAILEYKNLLNPDINVMNYFETSMSK